MVVQPLNIVKATIPTQKNVFVMLFSFVAPPITCWPA